MRTPLAKAQEFILQVSISMRIKPLTKAQVLKRMANGDLPVTCGGYSDAAVFNDGARVRHRTMNTLVKLRLVDRPVGTSCDTPYTLRHD